MMILSVYIRPCYDSSRTHVTSVPPKPSGGRCIRLGDLWSILKNILEGSHQGYRDRNRGLDVY